MNSAFVNELIKRLIVGGLSILIVGVAVYYAHEPWFSPIFVGLVASLTAVGLWEYYSMVEMKGLQPPTFVATVLGTAYIILLYVVGWWALCIPMALFFKGALRSHADALIELATALFGLIYVAIPMGCIVMLVYTIPNGQWWLIYMLATTKIGDMAAYFVGNWIGKNKLAPVISPRKTMEGAFGGLIASSLMSLALAPLVGLSFWTAPGLGLVIGVVAILGDLAESVLKRDAGVKDSNSLPGLGGVLDMLDSLLFTAPLVYFYTLAITSAITSGVRP